MHKMAFTILYFVPNVRIYHDSFVNFKKTVSPAGFFRRGDKTYYSCLPA